MRSLAQEQRRQSFLWERDNRSGEKLMSEPVHTTASELYAAGVPLQDAVKVTPTEGIGAADEWMLNPGDRAKLDAYREAHGSDAAE
jgi:hypothetical protein